MFQEQIMFLCILALLVPTKKTYQKMTVECIFYEKEADIQRS